MIDNSTELYNKFLNKWPNERIKDLSLQDYVIGASNYKETFSYWVETGTASLGDIGGLGGGGSFKHGIFHMSNPKNYEGNKRTHDETYAWLIKFGKDSKSAYEKIKGLLLDVISAAQKQDWSAIDKIDFYAPVKWKWAFMYSDQKLFPVFKREALQVAAKILGFSTIEENYAVLYDYLNKKRKNEESCFEFGARVWQLYLDNKPRNYYILGSKYGEGASVDVFDDMLEENVISTGFASEYNLEDLIGKPQNEIVEFLVAKDEESNSYSCLKYFLNIKPGDWIAVKGDGSPKGDEGFLSIRGIAEALDDDEFYGYDPDNLGHTLKVKWIKAPVYKEFHYGGYGRTIHKLTKDEVINDIFFSNYEVLDKQKMEAKAGEESVFKPTLNTILYGPPGTGKTYESIDLAVKTVNDVSSNEHKVNKVEFDRLRKLGQIEFVTFHQNYSYEDFMVGLRPDTENNELRFRKHRGIFYELAKRATDNYIASKEKKPLEKSFEEAFNQKMNPFIEEGKDVFVQMASGVSYKITDITDYSIHFKKPKGDSHHTLSIQTLKDIVEGTRSPSNGLSAYFDPLANEIKELMKPLPGTESEQIKRFVLIIDEINRANISKVFGELITLLEDDKRLGKENELKITLPNKEEDFGVPPNLYLIGTMNTADKSIALVDIALRRRFEFVAKYPDLTKVKEKEGQKLLEHINSKIYEKKKSADYLIGHGYFMKGQPVEVVLKKNIIPLLLEYFSGKTDIVAEIFDGSGWLIKYDSTIYDWKISKNQ